MPRIILCVVLILFLGTLKTAAQQRFSLSSDSSLYKGSIRVLPQNFYNQQLEFFCRQEDLLQKATKVNFYFRLGAKNYVDYLERKPNAAWGGKMTVDRFGR